MYVATLADGFVDLALIGCRLLVLQISVTSAREFVAFMLPELDVLLPSSDPPPAPEASMDYLGICFSKIVNH